MSVLPIGFGSEEGGYRIERSLRFNSSDSAFLNRTPASAGSLTTWTWSGWFKRSALGARQTFFSGGPGGSDTAFTQIVIWDDDKIRVGGWSTNWRITTQLFRDVSAWMHLVVVWDTGNATAADKVRVYVNGSRVTAFDTSNSPTNSGINQAAAHAIGRDNSDSTKYFSGYMAEIHHVDGSALDPTSFGEFNEDTGVWQPKAYTGSYGTNGFYLNFSDNSGTTSTTLGKDSSGLGNNWTPNNFSVTAGAGNDSLVDTPTNYGTDTGVGGEVRGNYCTMNPLANTGIGTLSNGNLTLVTSTNTKAISGTMALPSTGQYYFEITATDYVTDGGTFFGLVNNSFLTGAPPNGTFLGFNTYSGSYNNGTSTDTNGLTGTNVTNDGDIWCIAVDMTNGKFWIGRSRSGSLTWADGTTPAVNGSGATTLALPSGTLYPMAYRGGSFNETYNFNFGQRAFAHTAPSGFKALCTQNLPEPTIVDGGEYFNTVLYTGTGATRTVTGVGFQPDFTWIKSRSNTYFHRLYDAVRGATKALYSNDTLAEETKTGELTSFDSDGFSLGGDTGANGSGATFVAWNWKANGAGVTNTAGTITSTVSANTDSGFSIVTYTGTGAAATVGHGLGVAPAMYIVKRRTGGIGNWAVWHTGLSNTTTSYILLDSTAAQSTSTSLWGSTAATSTTIGVGTSVTTNNSSDTYVAYCFAAIPGYSAFGSWTGNASTDGPFVFTNFRPAFVMIKRTDSTSDWQIKDASRDPYNAAKARLWANIADAEASGADMDFLSNGFKIRESGTATNASGGTYIYAAFSTNPFKYSLGR